MIRRFAKLEITLIFFGGTGGGGGGSISLKSKSGKFKSAKHILQSGEKNIVGNS